MPGELTNALLSGDPVLANAALLRQIAEKLDAGICTHCGGPRGEAAGMASLTRQAIILLEKQGELNTDSEEKSTRDDLATRRAERRRAAAAQSPLATIRDSIERWSGGNGASG